MAKTDLQVNIRMPQELKDRLSKSAKSAGRSFTAEAVQRLQESFTFRESLARERAQSSKDRVEDALLFFALDVGATLEPDAIRRRAMGLIRTEQDAEALESIGEKINEAAERVRHLRADSEQKADDASDKDRKPRQSGD